MHELSLAGAIVDTATRHAGGRPVVIVRLRVGHLRQVVPDSLSFYFEHVARGTLCDGARLEQEVVAARLRCEDCHASWTLEAAEFRCPTCSSSRVSVVAGNELEVESIEVEDREVTCTA
jgi:hydrogenase nickel incorporation protein HypA/HybF